MNSDRKAHEVDGIKNVLIDGFRHRIDGCAIDERMYFLTHFHSDHYGGLHSSWNRGRIHCSRTTARLIINIIGVDVKWVESHNIGDEVSADFGKFIFLDANHCPGAVIILFHLSNGVSHLHTGDMRYISRMKEYPALQNVKISKLYLDTTYAHPKHQFVSQKESIAKIVNASMEFLSGNPLNGIIYLSAYTIGKERVIYAVADALKRKIAIDEDKWRIMQQIDGGRERLERGEFTLDPLEADVHVCQMGFVGSLFPFFKPNFESIRKHMQELNELHRETAGNSSTPKVYTKALAFLPTGWADASNFNRNNPVLEEDGIQVRIVPYSEHSQCSELIEFVSFLKPLEVVPTVYTDVRPNASYRVRDSAQEKNRLFILDLFRNCVDRTANMRTFLSKLQPKLASAEVVAKEETIKRSATAPAATTASKRVKSLTNGGEGEGGCEEVALDDSELAGISRRAVSEPAIAGCWACTVCTYRHSEAQAMFLQCHMCGSPRSEG